ncbi:MAG: hypothetical protein RI906_1262, partial [Pseudomonadota bacterium]
MAGHARYMVLLDTRVLCRLAGVVNLSNMKAKLFLRERRVLEIGFIEVVVWGLSQPMDGSLHRFKYRLAYVVRG